MSDLRVAHYFRRYPVPELAFANDQVVRSGGRRDVVLAERAVGEPGCVAAAPPAIARRRSASALARSIAALADRARDRLGWTLEARRSAGWLRRRLHESPCQLVHAHFGMAGAQLCAGGGVGTARLVTTFYGVDASACLQDAVWRARYEPLWRSGHGFVVLSERVVQRLVAAGAPSERVHVWDIGLDLSAYPYRQRSRSSGLRILCPARFVEKKGHAILLTAVAALREDLDDVRLTILGYGPLRDEIGRRAEELRLPVRIIDTAGRDDFAELYGGLLGEHDVVALPSVVATDGDDEGGPALTVVCAQAAGVPVVVTDFAGSERSVAHERTGLVCRQDSDDLARCLRRLADDEGLCHRLGRAGAECVRARFSLDRQLGRLEDIYRRALAT